VERKPDMLIRRLKLSAALDANGWCNEWSFWCMLNHAAANVLSQAFSDAIVVW